MLWSQQLHRLGGSHPQNLLQRKLRFAQPNKLQKGTPTIHLRPRSEVALWTGASSHGSVLAGMSWGAQRMVWRELSVRWDYCHFNLHSWGKKKSCSGEWAVRPARGTWLQTEWRLTSPAENTFISASNWKNPQLLELAVYIFLAIWGSSGSWFLQPGHLGTFCRDGLGRSFICWTLVLKQGRVRKKKCGLMQWRCPDQTGKGSKRSALLPQSGIWGWRASPVSLRWVDIIFRDASLILRIFYLIFSPKNLYNTNPVLPLPFFYMIHHYPE